MNYYSSYADDSKHKPLWVALGIVAALAVVAIPSYIWGWHVYVLRALFVTDFGQFLLVAGGVVIIVSALAIWLSAKDREGFAALISTVGVLAIGAAAIVIPMNGTYVAQKSYLASAEITTVNDEAVNSYEPRVPWEIASAQVDSNMGNFQGASSPVRALAQEGDTGEWNALVTARGFAKGYEGIVSIDSPIYGDVKQDAVERCEVDNANANLRVGGMLPSNDLVRAILSKVYFSRVIIDGNDVYGYCNENGEPMVIVPLKETRGFIVQTNAPWGVATYNGATGDLNITQDAAEIAALKGSTYPISIAAAQRNAFQSQDGSWWEHVQGRLGWDVVGNSELQLRMSDAGTEYFTALQPRGASKSVVAVFTTPTTMLTPGELNPVLINELSIERAGDAKIKDTIYNQYSSMAEFAGDKYEIYEIVPAASGEWVASIGSSQSIVYRVKINETGNSVTLVNSAGKEIKGSTITDEETGEVTVELDGSLEGMSEAELIDLLGDITDRLKVLNSTE